MKASALVSASPSPPVSPAPPLPAAAPTGMRGAPAAWLLWGIVTGAAVLRFAGLGAHSLWSDEVFVLWLSRAPWRGLLHLVAATDFHPPLYYALMKGWIALAGPGEAALRAPSAAMSVLAVWLAYCLARRVASKEVALLTALFVAVSPFDVMAGQEARMYPLLGALALGATLALLDAVERGGTIRWALYGVLAAAVAYTMYAGPLVLVAHGAWVTGWERRHLRSWLVALAGAAALYLPWAPSLWTQLVQGRAYYERVAVQEGRAMPSPAAAVGQVQDLLGLFAFGGSLFGTAGYHSAGASPALDRVAALLPFVATLACGVAALAGRPRTLAFVALPLVVTVGVLAAASAVKPVFSARWFSFLLPFWAMCLAQGIVSGADHVRANRRRIVACWTAGLLLYALPVLQAYYFDPAGWPFRWRDAAALVARQVAPGDLIVYADAPAQATFAYYFHGRSPSLTLSAGDRAGLTATEAHRLSVRFHRVWLVVNGPVTPSLRQDVLPALTAAFHPTEIGDFGGARVIAFQTTGGGGR